MTTKKTPQSSTKKSKGLRLSELQHFLSRYHRVAGEDLRTNVTNYIVDHTTGTIKFITTDER